MKLHPGGLGLGPAGPSLAGLEGWDWGYMKLHPGGLGLGPAVPSLAGLEGWVWGYMSTWLQKKRSLCTTFRGSFRGRPQGHTLKLLFRICAI